MHDNQYRVIKHITLALGRTLEESISEALGKKVKVAYEYSPDLKKAPGAVTVVFLNTTHRGGNAEREYERTKEGEIFRNPPLLLRSRFLISCWAPAPDDQELLGLVYRTMHDHPDVETTGEEEKTVSYEGRPTIEMESLSFDEHKTIADGKGMPVAPSACYWVDYVIQSARTSVIKRVKERVIDFKKIDG